MSLSEKTETTGAGTTVIRPQPTRQSSNPHVDVLATIEDVDSTHSLTPVPSRADEKAPGASPLSPLYDHASALQPLDAQKSKTSMATTSYDSDLEAGTMGLKGKGSLVKSIDCDDNSVWPCQNTLKMQNKARKRARRKEGVCGCLAGLDRRSRLGVKVLIVLLVIGAAVGIGIGISKAVGGGIWKSSHQSNAPISPP
ncbi:hypothetical protein F5884DRAFT_36206 [Xylogone sp. PMI_703]|nr:hypothetical protein F5884DRAFT_36206 [Xylogone sp. PMI_703]